MFSEKMGGGGYYMYICRSCNVNSVEDRHTDKQTSRHTLSIYRYQYCTIEDIVIIKYFLKYIFLFTCPYKKKFTRDKNHINIGLP